MRFKEKNNKKPLNRNKRKVDGKLSQMKTVALRAKTEIRKEHVNHRRKVKENTNGNGVRHQTK